MRFFLRKKNRLYIEKEIEDLFAQGSSHFIYPIKAIYKTYPIDNEDYSILVSVSKRNFKNAVDRNLIKRRIKEAFRKNCNKIVNLLAEKKIGVHIAFIYVSNKKLGYKEIEELIIKQITYLTNHLSRIE